MYAAVYFAGPRWNETVVENVRLGAPAVPTQAPRNHGIFLIMKEPAILAVAKAIERDGASALEWVETGRTASDTSSQITLHLDKFVEIMERYDPSLRSLDTAIDCAMSLIPSVSGAPREISVKGVAPLD